MEAFILSLCYTVKNSDIYYCDNYRVPHTTMQGCGDVGASWYDAMQADEKKKAGVTIYLADSYLCMSEADVKGVVLGGLLLVDNH